MGGNFRRRVPAEFSDADDDPGPAQADRAAVRGAYPDAVKTPSGDVAVVAAVIPPDAEPDLPSDVAGGCDAESAGNSLAPFGNRPEHPDADGAMNLRDRRFLEEIDRFIRANLDNGSLSVCDIAGHLRISRSMLYLRWKQLARGSVHDRIRDIRLTEACRLLDEGLNVSETSYAVGIADPNYFTKCFKRRFGVTPSEYLRRRGGRASA